MRPMYLGTNTESKINGEILSPEEFREFSVNYLKTNGDHDLFLHCLSKQKYLKFDEGNYICSDSSIRNPGAKK